MNEVQTITAVAVDSGWSMSWQSIGLIVSMPFVIAMLVSEYLQRKPKQVQPAACLVSLPVVDKMRNEQAAKENVAEIYAAYSAAMNADAAPDHSPPAPKPACSYCTSTLRPDGFCHACRKWSAE